MATYESGSVDHRMFERWRNNQPQVTPAWNRADRVSTLHHMRTVKLPAAIAELERWPEPGPDIEDHRLLEQHEYWAAEVKRLERGIAMLEEVLARPENN